MDYLCQVIYSYTLLHYAKLYLDVFYSSSGVLWSRFFYGHPIGEDSMLRMQVGFKYIYVDVIHVTTCIYLHLLSPQNVTTCILQIHKRCTMLATADCVSNCHVDGKRLHLKYTTTNTFPKTGDKPSL